MIGIVLGFVSKAQYIIVYNNIIIYPYLYAVSYSKSFIIGDKSYFAFIFNRVICCILKTGTLPFHRVVILKKTKKQQCFCKMMSIHLPHFKALPPK